MMVYYKGADGEEHIASDNAKRSTYILKAVMAEAERSGTIRVNNDFIPWHRVIRIYNDDSV